MWSWVKTGRVNTFVTPDGRHRIRRKTIERIVSTGDAADDGDGTRKTVLVVDDDPSIRKLFKRRLERRGYRAVTAANGFEAGVFVYRQKPDLVLLDLFMEGVDGFEVCRTIKHDPTLKHIQVLALSGVDTPEIHKRVFREGADGFFSKRIDLKCVLDHIDALLNPA